MVLCGKLLLQDLLIERNFELVKATDQLLVLCLVELGLKGELLVSLLKSSDGLGLAASFSLQHFGLLLHVEVVLQRGIQVLPLKAIYFGNQLVALTSDDLQHLVLGVLTRGQ